MKLTDEITQQKYLEAQSVLEAVLRSRVASRDQKRAALDSMDELDRRFLNKTMASLEARTKQFRQFIRQMESIVEEIEGRGSPFEALKRLKGIVDDANNMLDR